MTKAEKRQTVDAALRDPAFVGLSDRAIARRLAVPQPMVGTRRRLLSVGPVDKS